MFFISTSAVHYLPCPDHCSCVVCCILHGLEMTDLGHLAFCSYQLTTMSYCENQTPQKIQLNLKIFNGGLGIKCQHADKEGGGYSDRDEVLMGRYQAAAEVSYAEKKKESVFVVRLRGGIDLPSSWLTFFFRQSSSASFLSHTHTHSQGLALIFLQFPLSLPHCPDQSLCLLKPPPQHTQLYCSHCQMNYIQFFLFSEVPSTLFLPHGNPTSPVHSLMLILVCIMGGSKGLQAARIKSSENLLK